MYCVLSLAFLRFWPTSAGLLYAGDNTPLISREFARSAIGNTVTAVQIHGTAQIGGSYVPEQGSWAVSNFLALPILLGFDPSLVQRLGYVSVCAVAASGVYILLRRGGISRLAGFFGGLVYGFGVNQFTFIGMGWVYLLWALAALPFLIMLWEWGVRRASIWLLPLVGAISGLVVFSSALVPALLLVAAIFLCHFAVEPGRLWSHETLPTAKSVGRALLILATMPILHLFWVIPRLVYPAPAPVASLAESAESLGTSVNVTSLTPLTLLGTSFNDSFARLLTGEQQAAIVGLGALAVLGLVVPISIRMSRIPYAVLLVALVALSAVPAASQIRVLSALGLGRDSGRLLVVAALPIAVFSSIALEALFRRLSNKIEGLRVTAVIVIVLVISGPYWKPGIEQGNRPLTDDVVQLLKPVSIPVDDMNTAAQILISENEHWTAIAIPHLPLIAPESDTRFFLPYQTMTNPLGQLVVPSLPALASSKSVLTSPMTDLDASREEQPDQGREEQLRDYVDAVRATGARYVVAAPSLMTESDLRWLEDLKSHRDSNGVPTFVRSQRMSSTPESLTLFELSDPVPSYSMNLISSDGSVEEAPLVTSFANPPELRAFALTSTERRIRLVSLSIAVIEQLPLDVEVRLVKTPEACVGVFESGTFEAPRSTSEKRCLQEVGDSNGEVKGVALPKISGSRELEVVHGRKDWSYNLDMEFPPGAEGDLLLVSVTAPVNDLQRTLFFVSTAFTFGWLTFVLLLYIRKCRSK